MKIKLACLALFSLSPLVHAQTTIADWSWNSSNTNGTGAPYNSPSATSGVNGGTASVLGMNNSYAGASIAYADVTQASKTTNVLGAASGEYGWRIRGGSTAGGAGSPNGWNSAAAIGTQGAEFAASTAGFNNINVSFDLTATAQGEANLAVEYTTDGINWNVATLSYTANALGYVANNTTSLNTIDGDYFHITSVGQGNIWFQDISFSLNGITAANDDANFAFEVVNASTGADCINAKGTALNNSSGNIQLNNIDVTGTPDATPEPAGIALASVGTIAGLLALRRNWKA